MKVKSKKIYKIIHEVTLLTKIIDSALFNTIMTIFLFLLIIPLFNIFNYSNYDRSNIVFSNLVNPGDGTTFSELHNLSNNNNDSVYGQIQSVDKNSLALV